ncbi:hypothetical protein ScPMuIL_008751 [Solemya velum]
MSASIKTCQKYLLQFANEHVDFRTAELTALANLYGTTLKEDNLLHHNIKSPFLEVEFASEHLAKKIAGRSVLIKSLYELWSSGSSYEELNRKLKHLPAYLIAPYLKQDQTFRIQVDGYNKKLVQTDKVRKIEDLPLDFKGKVQLKEPDNSFHLLEYYGSVGEQPPDNPYAVYFGRWLADGQRDRIGQYHLQKRHFIGNTSMDAGLSMLMSNMGQVQRSRLVFDPFVGTGSLLVACAHHGGYVAGADIDYLLLHAKGKPSRHNQKKRASDESVRANLQQYGLSQYYIDILVADSSKQSLWRTSQLFDAIITDPPYGIREGAKKIGAENEDCYLTEEDKDGHVPQRINYQLSDIFKDLLNFAAKYLRQNGRLVYWFPVYIPDYREENIPTHPYLKLVSNCEQRLTAKVARRLVTMEKIMNDTGGEINEASIAIDHYEDASFRQKYFQPNRPTPNTSNSSLIRKTEK